MNNRLQFIRAQVVIAGLLAGAAFVGLERGSLAAEPPVDPVHAAHVASGAMPPDTAKPDPALLQKLSELQAKLAQLETAVAKNAPSSAAAAPAAGAMPGMVAPAAPMAGSVPPAPGGATNMMGMMDQMMGMMDKMMSMGGAMPAAAAPMPGGGMGMMKDEMSGMSAGAMPPAATPGMPGGGMGMDQMGMASMMGMSAMPGGAAGKMSQSALPGFPGASHLYHIGATDFFLDHPQHIALTVEQQGALNKAKEQAVLAKSAADRAVAQSEQDLWSLTASEQPDAAKIETKIHEIEKLRGDERLDFIRSVGEASKLLTDEQRKILTGFAAPVPATAAPAMSAPASAPAPMNDM